MSNTKGERLRHASTPFIDENLLPVGQDPSVGKDDTDKGLLAPVASKVLMKLLYAARMARWDLLRPVCALAACVARWTKMCDKMLHKLVCYVNSTVNKRLVGYVGDELLECWLEIYTDADLAGCKLTKKSTSGVFLVLVGPHTYFPLSAVSKRQTAVSNSSTESELLPADLGLRSEAIPMLDLWRMLLGHGAPLAEGSSRGDSRTPKLRGLVISRCYG